MEKMATLQEIETHWSLLDLLDANDVLDYKYKLQRQAMDQAMDQAKNKRGRR